MKVAIVDLRRRMVDVLRALERNEPVTILYRGREKGIIYPPAASKKRVGSISDHPAFGMWKDHEAMQDVGQAVCRLRKGRFHAI